MPVAAREVAALEERTTSGTSEAISLEPLGETLYLMVSVAAVTGRSPTLDLSVEWSHDGSVWAVADNDTFRQITQADTQVIKGFNIKAPLYRVRWVLDGASPSFTFSVGESASGS